MSESQGLGNDAQMINCVMLVKDRPRLTRQALETFVANTDVEWTLCLVDDASGPETASMLRIFAKGYPGKVVLLRNETSSGITAQVRNLGVYWSERRFGQGKWLCLLDNDVFCTAGWASKLIDSIQLCGPDTVLGGQNHPYHQPTKSYATAMGWCIQEYYALAGTSWLMSWMTWLKFGPLVETGAPGVGQSEDAAFSSKVREFGGLVGSIDPPCVYDCGLTQTGGTLSPGHDVKPRVDGVYYE